MAKYCNFRTKSSHPLKYLVDNINKGKILVGDSKEDIITKETQRKLRCKIYSAIGHCEICNLALIKDEVDYCQSCKECLHKEWSEFKCIKS